jgi:hypothetical protein
MSCLRTCSSMVYECRGDEGSVRLYPVAYVCVYVWRMGVVEVNVPPVLTVLLTCASVFTACVSMVGARSVFILLRSCASVFTVCIRPSLLPCASVF